MTPGAQAPAEAREGYVTYDELPGPRLDAARWSPARLPLPTGGEHLALDRPTACVSALGVAKLGGTWLQPP